MSALCRLERLACGRLQHARLLRRSISCDVLNVSGGTRGAQAFKVLGYAGQTKLFSQAAVSSADINTRAISIIGFVAVGELFIMSGQ